MFEEIQKRIETLVIEISDLSPGDRSKIRTADARVSRGIPIQSNALDLIEDLDLKGSPTWLLLAACFAYRSEFHDPDVSLGKATNNLERSRNPSKDSRLLLDLLSTVGKPLESKIRRLFYRLVRDYQTFNYCHLAYLLVHQRGRVADSIRLRIAQDHVRNQSY